MSTALGYLELTIFCAFVVQTLYKSEKMIECVIFSYICQIINYKLVGTLAWVSIVGVSLYPSDFVAILMVAILMVRVVRFDQKVYVLFVCIFLVMVIQSALRGLMAFHVTSRFLADLRKYLHFSVALLYFWLMPAKKMDAAFWKSLSIIFWGITIYMWITLAFYFAGFPLGERASQRPLLSDYAIVYTVYIAIRYYQDLILSENPKLSWDTLLFSATLILNRFNTTWAALAMAVGVVMVGRYWDQNHRKLKPVFYVQVALMLAVGFFLMHSAGAVTDSLVETSNKFDSSQNNTFSSRIELWQGLMEFVHGHYAWIGYPFGSGFYAMYRGSKWQATPHNGYIETLLRTGYIGLAAMLMCMFSIIWKAIKKRNVLPIVICVACMTYWVAYSLSIEQGALIGICAQLVFGAREYKNAQAQSFDADALKIRR